MGGTVELVEKRQIWGSACAIYAVPTLKAGTVFMRVTASNYRNDQRAVVVVDAQKFLAAWQRNPRYREPLAFANEHGWRNDYKFEDAEKGFSHGIENPVPLALVGVDDDKIARQKPPMRYTQRQVWPNIQSLPSPNCWLASQEKDG